MAKVGKDRSLVSQKASLDSSRKVKRFRLTPQAEEDLFEIRSFIAKDNFTAANQVEEAIYDACAFVGQAPICGHMRKNLTALPLLK